MSFRIPLRRRKGGKPLGALEVFLLVLLVIRGYVALTYDSQEEKQKREMQQWQTWQAQPMPTWWSQTQTAVWAWDTPTPMLTLTATPLPQASLYPEIESVPDAKPTGTRSDKDAEDSE